MASIPEAIIIASQLLPLLHNNAAYLSIPLLAAGASFQQLLYCCHAHTLLSGCVQTRFTRLCLATLVPNAILTSMHGDPSLTLTLITTTLSLALWHWVPLPTLPKPTGPFEHVAARDFRVPGQCAGRILYPCTPPTVNASLPYTATVAFPRTFLAFGAPSIVQQYFWFVLDHWLCVNSHLRPQGVTKLLPVSHAQDQSTFVSAQGLPVVIFSHGLGGNATLYSTLVVELASHGLV